MRDHLDLAYRILELRVWLRPSSPMYIYNLSITFVQQSLSDFLKCSFNILFDLPTNQSRLSYKCTKQVSICVKEASSVSRWNFAFLPIFHSRRSLFRNGSDEGIRCRGSARTRRVLRVARLL